MPCERRPMQLCGDAKCDAQIVHLPSCGTECVPKFENGTCCPNENDCWESSADGNYLTVETISTKAQLLAAIPEQNKIFLVTNDICLDEIQSFDTFKNSALIGVKCGVVRNPCDPCVTYVGLRKNGDVYDSILFFKGKKHCCPTYEYYVAKKRHITFTLFANSPAGVFETITNSVVGFLDFRSCDDILIGENPGINFGGITSCATQSRPQSLTAQFQQVKQQTKVKQNALGSLTSTNSKKKVGWNRGPTPVPAEKLEAHGDGIIPALVQGVGIFVGNVGATLIESVDLHISRVIIFGLRAIGCFIGGTSDEAQVYRCNVIADGHKKCNSVFGIFATENDASSGGFVGSNEQGIISNCSIQVSGYKDVQIGSVDPIGINSGVGGFCGINREIIKCCQVKMCKNKNIVIGLPFGKESGIVPDSDSFGGIGFFAETVFAGVGGFCGINGVLLDNSKAIYEHNCDIIIGSDVYLNSDAIEMLIGYMSAISGVGGFCGFVAQVFSRDGISAEMRKCELVISENRDITVGVHVRVTGKVSGCYVGGVFFNAIAGIGGFYGSNIFVPVISGCIETYCKNRVLLMGFDVNVHEVGDECIIGSMSIISSEISGIGGFAGISVWDDNGTVKIERCGAIIEDNMETTIGIIVNVRENVGLQNFLGTVANNLVGKGDEDTGISGEGGFFGLLFANVTYATIRKCGGRISGGRDVVIGNRVNVGGCISEGNTVAKVGAENVIVVVFGNNDANANAAAGIGGFGGYCYSNASAVFSDCILVFEKNCDVKIGAVGGCQVTDNPPLLYGAIGGFWGYAYGYVVFKHNDDAIYKNKCQLLIYKSSTSTRVHMNPYVGYCSSDPAFIDGK